MADRRHGPPPPGARPSPGPLRRSPPRTRRLEAAAPCEGPPRRHLPGSGGAETHRVSTRVEHGSVSAAVARGIAPQPPRIARRTPASNAWSCVARPGSAKRRRRRQGTKGTERRFRDRRGGGFVLTVCAGLGFRRSGGPGVRRTRQCGERTGEQIGYRRPGAGPGRSRQVGGRRRRGYRVRGDRGRPGQGRGCADRRLRHLRHQEPSRPHGAQSEDRRKPEHRRLDRTDVQGRQAVEGCRERGKRVVDPAHPAFDCRPRSRSCVARREKADRCRRKRLNGRPTSQAATTAR